jgi:hypothetical protein
MCLLTLSAMNVSVSLEKGTHPQYLTKILSVTDGKCWQFKYRFKNYREFFELTQKSSPDVVVAQFPPTFILSSYGVKLSESRIINRYQLLQEVILFFLFML